MNNQDKNLKGISFDYKEKHYDGELNKVLGAGTNAWHLSVNNYYYGTLTYTGKWVFHNNRDEMKELADLFGNQVMLWYE